MVSFYLKKFNISMDVMDSLATSQTVSSKISPFLSLLFSPPLHLFPTFHFVFSSLESFDMFPSDTSTSSTSLSISAIPFPPNHSRMLLNYHYYSFRLLSQQQLSRGSEILKATTWGWKANWKQIRYFIPQMGFRDTQIITWSPFTSSLKIWSTASTRLQIRTKEILKVCSKILV